MDASQSQYDPIDDNTSFYSLPFGHSPRYQPFPLSSELFGAHIFKPFTAHAQPDTSELPQHGSCKKGDNIATAPHSGAKDKPSEVDTPRRVAATGKAKRLNGNAQAVQCRLAGLSGDVSDLLSESQCIYAKKAEGGGETKEQGDGLGFFKLNNDLLRNSAVLGKRHNRQVRTIYLKGLNNLQKKEKPETRKAVQKIHKKRGRKPKNTNIDFVNDNVSATDAALCQKAKVAHNGAIFSKKEHIAEYKIKNHGAPNGILVPNKFSFEFGGATLKRSIRTHLLSELESKKRHAGN